MLNPGEAQPAAELILALPRLESFSSLPHPTKVMPLNRRDWSCQLVLKTVPPYLAARAHFES